MNVYPVKYEIISSKLIEQNPSESKIDSVVYKITDANKVPKVVLFTDNTGLIDHLLQHGYIAGNSLTSQLIAFIGQRRSKELLARYMLTQKINTFKQKLMAEHELLSKLECDTALKDSAETQKLTKIKKYCAQLQKKIKKQHLALQATQFNYDLITKLQNKILTLSDEERQIPFSDFEKQRQFKNKLSRLILDAIRLNKQHYQILTPNSLQIVLSNAISLVYSFKFPTPSSIYSSKSPTLATQFSSIDQSCHFNLTSSSDEEKKFKKYIVEPEKYNKFTNALDRIQFYLTLNCYKGSDQSHVIKQDKFDELPKKFLSTNSILSDLFQWVYTYKFRIAVFIVFMVLQNIYLIPTLTPIFISLNLFHLFGLSNTLVMWTTLISLNITLVNSLFSYKKLAKQFHTWLTRKFAKSTDLLVIDPSPSELIYRQFLKFREDLYLRKNISHKPSNILWHIPLLSHIVTFIEEFYEKYTMNYFANIHRFPLGFSFSYFLGSTPIGKALKLLINSYAQLGRRNDDRTNLETFDSYDGNPHIPSLTVDIETQINKGYIILRRNSLGQYECYRQNTQHHYRIINEEELLQLVADIKANKQEDNHIFCFNNFRWQRLDESNSLQQLSNAQNITLPDPDYWQPAPSLFSRIFTSLKLFMLTGLIKQIIIDSLKLLFIRLPVILLYILINKIILTTAYIVVFFILNIISIPIGLIGRTRLQKVIVDAGCKIFEIYYRLYYSRFHNYFDRFNKYIENIDSYSFRAHQLEATLKGYNTPELSWLEKNHPYLYKQAKRLETYLSIAEINIDDLNKHLDVAGFKEQTKNLLVIFYDESRKFYYDQKSPNPRLSTDLYLKFLEQKLQPITRQVDIIKFYINSQHVFECSFVKQNPFDYMKMIIKLKSAIYFCSPHADPKERDFIDQFIRNISERTTTDSKANAVELMTELFNLLHNPKLSDDIKKDLVQPCINQSSAVYGKYPLELMTRLRDFRSGATTRSSKMTDSPQALPQPKVRPRSLSI